ncbi:MAG: DUF2007 domain-containing protein, partial [Gemmataceae bacterium]
MSADDLVTVFTTNDSALANIVANELRDEGIPAEVEGGNQAGFTGVLDVEVQVKASDAERAAELIKHHEPMSEDDVDVGEAEP